MNSDENVRDLVILHFDPGDKEITSEIRISCGEKTVNVRALWDTGATKSCVAKDVIEQLGAVSRKAIPCTVDGKVVSRDPVYMLDIEISPILQLKNFEMVGSSVGSRFCKAIIGMDIIAEGQFAFMNNNGRYIAVYEAIPQNLGIISS